ncbi:MAG: hypothetical protein AAGE52_23590 [Myxococcota bacterium]
MRMMLLAVFLLACGGDREMGESCGSDRDCQAGLCVAGADGPDPICTKSCASSEECPEGWTCSGATQENVLICVHRAATPFGQ